MRKAAEEYSETMLAKLREYEFNPEIMRLTVMGGGACILKHFWNGENCRVQYIEDTGTNSRTISRPWGTFVC